MPAGLLTGLSTFKTLFDMAKGLKDISDTAIRNAAIVELQEKILAAQSQQAALVDRVRELEAAMAKLEEWKAEKRRYRLTDYGGGTFAYALKPEESGGEPLHCVCATCYQEARKSILQFLHENSLKQKVYHCERCKTDVRLGTPREPPDSYSPPRGSAWSA